MAQDAKRVNCGRARATFSNMVVGWCGGWFGWSMMIIVVYSMIGGIIVYCANEHTAQRDVFIGIGFRGTLCACRYFTHSHTHIPNIVHRICAYIIAA